VQSHIPVYVISKEVQLLFDHRVLTKVDPRDLDFVMKFGLCSDYSCTYISDYSFLSLRRAVWLLSVHWHKLTITQELQLYVRALQYRTCMLMGELHTDLVFNSERGEDTIDHQVDIYRVDTRHMDEQGRVLYRASGDALRWACGPLVRMYIEIHFWTRMEKVQSIRGSSDDNDKVSYAALSTNINNELKRLQDMADLGKDIQHLSEKSFLMFGDVE
jgi:hypothetical protein